MCDYLNKYHLQEGQCQYFVVRKKRLCRMTVKPGRHYCGEHEPQPKTDDDKEDSRIPCPYDPKHTCFATKLEKHLKICNAREQTQPEYIIHNVNAPTDDGSCPRLPLNLIPLENILNLINKVNELFDNFLKDKIASIPEKPIHSAVLEEFNEPGREESSLRHLRQVSSLLHLMEDNGMVQPNTCYIELGAGKGRLAAIAWRAWCEGKEEGGDVLLVERAALRHKRDNGTAATRLRADLAHLVLAAVPAVTSAKALVAIAKHLCGVATDYSLRCVCAADVVRKMSGVVLATCCHHRADRAGYVAAQHLQKLGITDEEFNIMLGIVSWATCGDGRSRDRRKQTDGDASADDKTRDISGSKDQMDTLGTKHLNLDRESREEVGRRAKAIIDWGRVLYLREHGFDARLVHYVPKSVSLENVCIVAKRIEVK